MINIDDILYPVYLEYYENKSGFYSHNIESIRKVFKEYFDGVFQIVYTMSKRGNHCYAVNVVYNNHFIKNNVGYNTKDAALMSVVDAMRNNRFERFI